MYANSPFLRFTSRATSVRVPVAYGEWMKRLEMGKCQANIQKTGSSTVPSPSPPHTQSHKVVKQAALPWQLPDAPPHTIYRCLFYNRLCYQYRESKQLYLIHRNKHRGLPN